MRYRQISTVLATTCTALALAACGGDDDGDGGMSRLSGEELSARLGPAVERISGEFCAVFEQLGRAGEGDRVPADVRERLRQAAQVERDVAARLAKMEPPERADTSFERLAGGAEAQAERLEQLAEQADLTVAEMADAVESGETTEPIRELAEGGYVEPPGHC